MRNYGTKNMQGNEWNWDKRSNDNTIKKIYRPKQKGINVEEECVNKEFRESSSKNETNGPDGRNKESSPKQNIWRINKRDMENLKRSANKFAVLQDNDIETVWNDPCFDKRLFVDIFLKRKQQPTLNDTIN
ncbi:hypothetical protein Tco_1147227 [Tanacetum coccineum]